MGATSFYKNLSVAFKQDDVVNTAVKNISIDVNKNETVAIVGESGSGKSVTSLSILTLLPKQAQINGEIIFSFNKDELVSLTALSDKAINAYRGNAISMIFQEPMTSLNPVFTCGHQVMEVLQLHKKISAAEAKKQTIALFEKVKLPSPSTIINRYPHELSGGQKQRVMIAMAISCNPALLIADEPTTALDVTVQKTILELLKELQVQNGMSVILITHDLGLVADVADKVVVMYKGEIVEQGNTKKILKEPKHWYTKALLACRPAANAKGSRLPVVADFEEKNVAVESLKLAEANGKLQIDRSQLTKPQTTVLQVENLKVYFKEKKKLFSPSSVFKAVDDVSFNVLQGETIGLVGESGCGKTTLGRAILQLVPTTAGKIILNGKDITTLSTETLRNYRKDLQIVFQDPYGSLNPRLTIGEAILEPLNVHAVLSNKKLRKEKVIDLLEKVSLPADFYNRYPHQFSGGQRQRICIARALALNPSFLIFDESVSALDVSVQAQVLNLLSDLKKEFGFTAIFISHDLSVVHYVSDRILVMHQGQIIEHGFADDIYFNPKETYTQQLLDAIPGKKSLYSS
ncbi:MAG: ABC transporter ATP-binding protein [Chitinophagaceae bacterium]|nr:ABC transporter ATP-binding protein [Chitinophagaceae bacterium]